MYNMLQIYILLNVNNTYLSIYTVLIDKYIINVGDFVDYVNISKILKSIIPER